MTDQVVQEVARLRTVVESLLMVEHAEIGANEKYALALNQLAEAYYGILSAHQQLTNAALLFSNYVASRNRIDRNVVQNAPNNQQEGRRDI